MTVQSFDCQDCGSRVYAYGHCAVTDVCASCNYVRGLNLSADADRDLRKRLRCERNAPAESNRGAHPESNRKIDERPPQ